MLEYFCYALANSHILIFRRGTLRRGTVRRGIFRRWDTSPLGHFAVGTFRRWDTSPLGHFAVWDTSPWDISPLGHFAVPISWDILPLVYFLVISTIIFRCWIYVLHSVLHSVQFFISVNKTLVIDTLRDHVFFQLLNSKQGTNWPHGRSNVS